MTACRFAGVQALGAVALLLATALPLAGQTAPSGTDVFLVPLKYDGTRLGVGDPVNLTARAGYDNQPAFTSDGLALLYSMIGADGHADVCRIVLATRARSCWNTTPESEYSPAPAPRGGISVVRVERDSTQRLWAFRDDGSPELLLPGLKPVGYYAWIDADRVAAFVLGTPATLQLADLRSGIATVIASDISRSVQRMPGGSGISFQQKDGDGWLIRKLDPATGQVTTITPGLPGSDFHVWMPDGSLLMARGDELFSWHPGQTEWLLVAAFAADGLRQITRLAVSPDGSSLAFVAEDPGA